MNRFLTTLTVLVFLVSLSKAQERTFESFKQKGHSFEIKVSDGLYVLTPYTANIIHSAFYPDSLPIDNQSYAAVLQPQNPAMNVIKRGEKIRIASDAMSIEIQKQPFAIHFFQKDKLLFEEIYGYALTDTSQKRTLTIDKNDILYGGGERVLGMNRRGHRLQIYNRAHYGYTTHSELMNYAIPMYLSSEKYAVLFDNASHAFLDLDSQGNNQVTYETFGGTTNYFVITADDWYCLTENYTQLTGRQPLPPRWALGNFSSRFGYHTQEEVLSTVDKFFQDDIPVDAVILDLYWFGPDIKGKMGNLKWDRSAFPEPKKMMDSLRSRGVKTVLVTEPFILTTSKRWDEAVREDVLGTDKNGFPYKFDFYFGNTGLIDVFKLNARRWFWDIYKRLAEQGVAGWWGDLGEPEVHPADLQHVNGSAEEVHNAYGHEWASIIHEGYRKDFLHHRPFILMRAGFAGSQRYGMIPWTGDVSRSWGGLVPQPEISLQMGMQGVAYTHSDLGGFAGGDSLNTELYRRWLQYGVFQPVYRPHAQEAIPSEPVFMPDSTKNRVREAIKLRYKLMPYIYNMAFENHIQGTPLMIPLFYEEHNEKTLEYDEAYLWGKSLLVSPVKQPGVKKQEVYFPEGQSWFGFYSGEKISGGQSKVVDVLPDHIPVFAKGGAFIPMKAEAKSTNSYNLDRFDMHFFTDESADKSSYKLYNDDGKTPGAFEKGVYEMMHFSSENNKDVLKLSYRHEKGTDWTCKQEKNIRFIVHNTIKKPRKILVNGEKQDKKQWRWNRDKSELTINIILGEKAILEIVK